MLAQTGRRSLTRRPARSSTFASCLCRSSPLLRKSTCCSLASCERVVFVLTLFLEQSQSLDRRVRLLCRDGPRFPRPPHSPPLPSSAGHAQDTVSAPRHCQRTRARQQDGPVEPRPHLHDRHFRRRRVGDPRVGHERRKGAHRTVLSLHASFLTPACAPAGQRHGGPHPPARLALPRPPHRA